MLVQIGKLTEFEGPFCYNVALLLFEPTGDTP